MRTIKEYQQVKELFDSGKNKCEISRITNIPRSTIKEWLVYGFWPKALDENLEKTLKYKRIEYSDILFNDEKSKAYSFILGEYLGDGYIRNLPNTYRFDIYNDKKYENINKMIELKLSKIFPLNKVNRLHHAGCWIITVHNCSILNLFPQHGSNEKWQRKIELTEWQKEIIKKYPFEFLKGLFYSDGCIFKDKKYGKYHYNFSQKSFAAA